MVCIVRISCIFIVQGNEIIYDISLLETFQCTVWTLQSTRKLLHSWIMQVVVTQVQISQMGEVGTQSWGQESTAFLCDQTSWQTGNIKKHWWRNVSESASLSLFKTVKLYRWAILTWESREYSLDSPVPQRETSPLNPAGRCYSGPALSV